MLNTIAHFFLAFSHDTFIIPLVIIGYIWLDQKIFFHAICFILTSILFNFALKVTFQVPLSPAFGKGGFAFPSGHMQSSVVLYGWLMAKMRNPLYSFLGLILLLGIGLSLIYFGYHNYVDIIGGAFFGFLLIFVFLFLLNNKNKTLPLILFLFSTLLMAYVSFLSVIPEHLWMAYYALIGVVCSEHLFARRPVKTHVLSQIAATIFCFAAVFAVKKLFGVIGFPTFFTRIQWVVIGFCVPFSLYFFNFFHKK